MSGSRRSQGSLTALLRCSMRSLARVFCSDLVRQCIFHAITVAHVPDPIGRLLEAPVPGWPEPQVLVSAERLWRTHRAFVHLFGGEETSPLVSQVPQGATLGRVHALIGRFPPLSCWVHDQLFDCTQPLPDDVDYARVIEADSEVFDARILGLDTPDALPREHWLQPAYGTHFRARGYVRHHGFPTGIAGRSFIVPHPPESPAASASSSSSIADDSSSCSGGPVEALMEFTVFDTYHHARVLRVNLPASKPKLLQAIWDATPELAAPHGHRVLREALAGFPVPQFVVWTEPASGVRTIPVMHPAVNGAVCTVEVPLSCTTFHLAWLVEQACASPREYRVAIARQLAHFSLDGASFPPFIDCNFGAIDSATFGRGPHKTFRLSTARWARPLPQTISTVTPEQISDAPFNEEVMVHQIDTAPRRITVPQHLGFGRMCSFLNVQLGRGTGWFRLPQFCPVVHGLPLHVVIDDQPKETSLTMAILDLRRVSDRADLDFVLVSLPASVNLDWVRNCACSFGISLQRVFAAYFDDCQLVGTVQPYWPVHVITCIAPGFRLPGSGPVRLPALLDTSDHLGQRIGVWQSRHRCADARSVAPVARDTPSLHYLGPDPCVDYDFHTAFDPVLLPAPDAFEVIVHMLHEPSVRVWVPRFASADAVCSLISRLTGVPDARLVFPRSSPCLFGRPCHAAALPSYVPTTGLAIVDARRVFPSHFQGMWLLRLPDRIPRAAVFAELLGDRRVSLTPCGVLCDGTPVGRDIAASDHLQVLTILAEAYDGTPCLDDNARAAREHPGFLQHLWGGGQTTRTTSMARSLSEHPTTCTTTNVAGPALHPAAPLLSADIFFHYSVLHGELHTHVHSGCGHIAEVLFEICQTLRSQNRLQEGDALQCHPRVFFTQESTCIFLHHGSPRVEAQCWIFAPWMRGPRLCRCGHGLTRDVVLHFAGVRDSTDIRIFLEGVRQTDFVRPFHGDVIIVTSRDGRVHSVPLHHLLHRFPDVQMLLLRHPLPTGRTARDPDLHRAYWRSIAHSCNVAFGLHRPGIRSTLAGVTFPCVVVCTGGAAPPTTAHIQAHWDRFLQPLFGPCQLLCSATMERDHALYVQRTSSPLQQPWVVRLPFGVDTFVGDGFGLEVEPLDLGQGWVLRADSCHPHFGLACVVPSDASRPARAAPSSAVLAGVPTVASHFPNFHGNVGLPNAHVMRDLPFTGSASSSSSSGLPTVSASILRTRTRTVRPARSPNAHNIGARGTEFAMSGTSSDFDAPPLGAAPAEHALETEAASDASVSELESPAATSLLQISATTRAVHSVALSDGKWAPVDPPPSRTPPSIHSTPDKTDTLSCSSVAVCTPGLGSTPWGV